MTVPKGQRGEGNIGCIFWAVVFAVIAYVAWTMVPIKIASAQLSDYMEDQAQYAEHRTPEEIKKSILGKAKLLGLPLDPKKLTVKKSADYIEMDAVYTVPVEFVGGYVYEWHFEHHINLPIFIV